MVFARIMKITFYLPFFLFSCDDDGNGTLINKSYDFILGFAVPDEDRSTSTEVFVGKLKPQNPEFFDPQGFSHTFLREQVFKFSDVYLAEVDYYDDAEVLISSDDQSVKLEHIGFGVYKDINDDLRIVALKKYTIEVKRPGGIIYTDEVMVPDDVNIIDINDQDTVIAYPKPTIPGAAGGICIAYVPVVPNETQYAYLYESKQSNNGPITDGEAKYINFERDRIAAPPIFEIGGGREFVNFQWEVIALDSTATFTYNPFGTVGLNREEADLLDFTQHPENLEERSSIEVNKNRRVIGNFGAYNSTALEFTVMAKRDSCDN